MNQIIYAGKHLVTYSVTRHAHNSWELIYYTGGEGIMHFDTCSLSYRAGDLVVIPPLLFHCNESETGFTNIHFNMLEPSLNLREPVCIHDDDNHFLLDACSGAFFQFSAEPGRQNALLTAYAFLLVTLINDQLAAPVRSPVVAEIENCILRSYPDENFELDSYLHSLPFNYDYVRKLFHKETGSTPHRFLSETRLLAAAEHLGFADAEETSISNIAHLCGFREPLYFSRMFRKKFGLSPKQYQEKLLRESHQAPDSESIKIEVSPHAPEAH